MKNNAIPLAHFLNLGIAFLGGTFGWEWIHIDEWLSPFAIHLKLSQHCLLIGYTPIQNKKLKKINLGIYIFY